MADLLIRNVPEDLRENLGRIARDTGRSLSDAAQDLIRRGIEGHRQETPATRKNAYKQLRDIFSFDDDKAAEDFAKIMDEIEEQRKKDPGRPLSFEE